VRSDPGYPCDGEARWRTARARAPRQWAVFAHPKIGRRRKSGHRLGMRQKLLLRKKKESKGKRLIGGHALTTLGPVTLALIRKGSSRQLEYLCMPVEEFDNPAREMFPIKRGNELMIVINLHTNDYT